MPRETLFAALEQSWEMLTGQSLTFAEASPSIETQSDHVFAITIHRDNQADDTSVVQITHGRLTELAAAMFAVDPAQLSDSELDDAGKELANILSSCFIRSLEIPGEVDIPTIMSAPALSELVTNSPITLRFSSSDNGVSVAVLQSKTK